MIVRRPKSLCVEYKVVSHPHKRRKRQVLQRQRVAVGCRDDDVGAGLIAAPINVLKFAYSLVESEIVSSLSKLVITSAP